MAEVVLCGLCIATGVFIKKMVDIRKDEKWCIKNQKINNAVENSTKEKED